MKTTFFVSVAEAQGYPEISMVYATRFRSRYVRCDILWHRHRIQRISSGNFPKAH